MAMVLRRAAWFAVALASLASLAGLAHAKAAAQPMVWDTKEAGVKLLLKQASNVTATEEGAEADHSCVAFLLYSTSCPFSRAVYADFEKLSVEYGETVAFVAMEKSLSSLNFLMQFGFHAVPQILVYSPVGRDKLRGSEKQTALQEYLRNLLINPNVSCKVETFSEVLPEVERLSRPEESDWVDGSQEMARTTWAVVAALSLVYAVPKLYSKMGLTQRKNHEE